MDGVDVVLCGEKRWLPNDLLLDPLALLFPISLFIPLIPLIPLRCQGPKNNSQPLLQFFSLLFLLPLLSPSSFSLPTPALPLHIDILLRALQLDLSAVGTY
jgi:hypothetical protein